MNPRINETRWCGVTAFMCEYLLLFNQNMIPSAAVYTGINNWSNTAFHTVRPEKETKEIVVH